jgi:O-antigen ligase
MLGFGEEFWGGQMRQEYAARQGIVVTHAHNDLLQALGRGGLVGLTVMLVYLLATVCTSLGTAATSRWTTVFVTAFILTRMSTEPLVTSEFGTPNFALHLFMFVLITQALTNVRGKRLLLTHARIGRPQKASERRRNTAVARTISTVPQTSSPMARPGRAESVPRL